MTREVLIDPDIEAEYGVLGSILFDPDAIALIADRLKPLHFYRDAHRTIYEAMLHLYEQRKDCDQFSVSDLLRRWDRLKDIDGQHEADGIFYIGMLYNRVEPGRTIEDYAGRVISVHTRTQLLYAGSTIANLAYSEEDVEQAITKSEELIYAIGRDEAPSDVVHVSQVATDFYEWLDRIPQGGAIVGVPTNLPVIDRQTGGLQKSDLVVIAARPGMGKSSLALTMARNAALDHRLGVLIFSLEMSRDQLFQRLTSMDARVNLKRLRTGQLTQAELDRVVGVAGTISEAPLYIDHTPALSVSAMRSRIRRTMARHDIDLIVVDYLQKMTATSGDGRRYQTEYQEVSEIVKELKNMAREFNLPVLALSQLSRESEHTADKIPQLSHLRATGAIEQEADIVMFIYREDYYKGKESTKPGIADIIFAKHRNGEMSELGEIQLGFEASQTRFYHLGSSQTVESAGRAMVAYAGGEDV